TLRLGLLHALSEHRVRVINSPRAIERCVDKSMTSFLLARAGVPTPATWAVEDIERARAIVADETTAGHELVAKPLFGSQGRGLRRVRRTEELPAADEVAGVWYLQRYIGGVERWHDYRVLVLDGVPLAAMRRSGMSWTTNICQGGRPEAVAATGLLA